MADDFSTNEEDKVGVYTWNMGGLKMYDHLDMKDWLMAGISKAADMPDILVIGIQEMIPLKASRLFTNNREQVEWVRNTIMKNLFNYASKEQF